MSEGVVSLSVLPTGLLARILILPVRSFLWRYVIRYVHLWAPPILVCPRAELMARESPLVAPKRREDSRLENR